MKKIIGLVSVFVLMVFAQNAAFPKICFSQEKADDLIDEGIALHDKGDYKGAIEKYQEALKLDPDNMGVYYEMSYSYFALGDFNKAIEYSDKVINSDADAGLKERAYMNKASALDDLGKTKEALQLYIDALKIYPDSQMLHYNIGVTYSRMKIYGEAEKAAINSIQRKPSHPGSHLLLGTIMSGQGKKAKSLLALYNFLLLEPNSKRSVIAYKTIKQILSSGVRDEGKDKDGKGKITVGVDGREPDEAFSTVELAIQLMEATRNEGKNKDKTDQEWFVEKTDLFFKILGESKKKTPGSGGFFIRISSVQWLSRAMSKHSAIL